MEAAMPAAGSGGRAASSGVGGSLPAAGSTPAGSGGGPAAGMSGMVAAAGSGGSAGAAPAAGSGGSPAPSVRWVGRVDARNVDAIKLGWQGAGFVATLQGSAIALKLRSEDTDTVFFQPVIDGKKADRFEVKPGADRTVMLASGLPDRDHRVELYRDTEGAFGSSTFLGFTSGMLKAAPPASGRRIEVVGDSISAGYGNLGVEPHPNWVANPACSYTTANSTWYQTYAAIAGRALDAEVSTIARSGWGMYRDADGNTANTLAKLYDRTLGNAATPVFEFEPKVDAVVINLGTNDWSKGDPGVPYETAYQSFLEHVRAKYPNAWLFLTIGSMLDATKLGQCKTRLQNVLNARASAGDQKVATFDLGMQDLGADGTVPTGCDWHPSVADHQRMAEILRQQLATKLGW
jgi:lysophospholipase L1-like esterase